MYKIIDYIEQRQDFDIVSFKEGDIPQLISLFERNFKRPMGETESINHFEWEYLQNPVGLVTILLAKTKEGEVMAQYALLPKRVRVMGNEYICTLSQDTVTDERHRGKGLFTLLADKMYDLVKEKGFLFTYGFPNRNSAHGFFNKLKWIRIRPIPVMIRPVYIEGDDYRSIPFAGRYPGLRSLYKYSVLLHNRIFNRSSGKEDEIEEIRDFLPVFDEIWQSYNDENICVIRDNRYIRWRFFDKPENNYRIYLIKDEGVYRGYFVISILNRFNIKILFLMDFLLQNRVLIKKVFSFLNRISETERCHLICSITPSVYSSYFYLSGFVTLPERFFPQELYFGFLPHNISDNKMIEKISKIKNWYITWSDIDVL